MRIVSFSSETWCNYIPCDAKRRHDFPRLKMFTTVALKINSNNSDLFRLFHRTDSDRTDDTFRRRTLNNARTAEITRLTRSTKRIIIFIAHTARKVCRRHPFRANASSSAVIFFERRSCFSEISHIPRGGKF